MVQLGAQWSVATAVIFFVIPCLRAVGVIKLFVQGVMAFADQHFGLSASLVERVRAAKAQGLRAPQMRLSPLSASS